MTSASTSPVTREMLASTYTRGKTRAIVIRLIGGLVMCKAKGTRQWHTVAASTVYMAGIRNTAEGIKQERKAKREERRKLRAAYA